MFSFLSFFSCSCFGKRSSNMANVRLTYLDFQCRVDNPGSGRGGTAPPSFFLLSWKNSEKQFDKIRVKSGITSFFHQFKAFSEIKNWKMFFVATGFRTTPPPLSITCRRPCNTEIIFFSLENVWEERMFIIQQCFIVMMFVYTCWFV